MRTLADLATLTAGLTADLFRKHGPVRRALQRLFRLPRRLLAGAWVLIRSARDRRAAWAALRVGCATTLARAGQRLQRAGAASIRVLRSGTQGSYPAAAQHAGGDASTVGSLADATSRGIASLARSVLTLPGGPSTVLAGAVAVLGLAAFAWLQPAESDRVQMRPFVVEYAFDYRAELPPNLVYEQRELRIGDPIFLGVIDAIDVTVDWSVPRGDVTISGGQLALTTLLRSDAGWTRVLERVPEVDVEGLRASSSVHIDFSEAMALARRIDEQAGVSRPVRLDVLVETLLDEPVAPHGNAATPVEGYSAATITFVLDERVVRLAEVPIASQRRETDALAGVLPRTGAASTETGGASTETGETSTETGSTSRFSQATPGSVGSDGRVGVREVVHLFATDVREPAHVRFGPLRLEVATARRNLTLLGGLLLAAGFLGFRVLRRIERLGEAAIIEARYGPLLTALPSGVNGHGAHAIDVGSFDALHTLALDRDTPIMVDRAHRPGAVAHYLFDGPTTYRYVALGRPLTTASGPRDPHVPLDDPDPDETTVDVGGSTDVP